jgi:hypothetical protein
VSRRRDSDAECEWFGATLLCRCSDGLGDAVGVLICNVDEDERERVTRGGNCMDCLVAEDLEVAAICILCRSRPTGALYGLTSSLALLRSLPACSRFRPPGTGTVAGLIILLNDQMAQLA